MTFSTPALLRPETSFTGNQIRDDLLRWLSPPDPSTNHNIARKAHHNGTTRWFFQGSIFNQWKSNGSLLWVHGKRVLIFDHYHAATTDLPYLYSRFRKEYCLVRHPSILPALMRMTLLFSVPRLYKISCPCAMLGGPQWPISISISGMLISKSFATSFHLSSNSQRGPVLVATDSPNSIQHMVVGYRSLVIGKWRNA